MTSDDKLKEKIKNLRLYAILQTIKAVTITICITAFLIALCI